MSEYATIVINTATTENNRYLTDDELVLLGQVIDIDGEDNVILKQQPLHNASGRQIGETWTITEEAWEFVQRAIADDPYAGQ